MRVPPSFRTKRFKRRLKFVRRLLYLELCLVLLAGTIVQLIKLVHNPDFKWLLSVVR